MRRKILLSLIIPAYNQEKTIKKNLLHVQKSLKKLKIPYEIILVIDGFTDKTRMRAKTIRSKHIHVLGYRNNHGKGYAVRFGMAKAKGNLIAFLDAGMDVDPKGIKDLLHVQQMKKSDIVIASKLHPNSKVIYPWQRKVLSWGYRSFVRVFFLLSIRDTQVGLKLFKREVLEDVLPRLLVKRYAFDIEMLAVAYYLGYTRIHEAPVKLSFQQWSSITSKNFLKTISFMMWDTCAVFYRLRIKKYYDNKSKRKWKFDPELNFRVNIG